MAMKYKGEKGIYILVCGIALLCVILPVILIAAIPVVIGTIVCLIIKSKKEKELQLLYDEAMTYINELDIMSEEDFEENAKEMIKRASSLGYEGKIYTEGVSINCYQSIDKIGIGVVRKDCGNQITKNHLIITNRYLTPQARTFCEDAMITVINRDDLINIYIYIKKSEQKQLQN